MPSTFDPLLRLELQAVGENENTWGTKVNTTFELLAKAIAGHLSINVAGSGDYTLTTNSGSDDQARNDFITLTGTLTGNRTIIIPASAKSYTFRRTTSGAFTLSVKTAAGNTVQLRDGINRIACDGTNCYSIVGEELATVDQVNAAVSVLAASTSVQFAATSVQLAAVSAQTSVNTAQIALVSSQVSVNAAQIVLVSAQTSVNAVQINSVSVLAQQALVSAGQKVNLVGGIMTGLLTLSGDPSAALGAATKQYVDTRITGITDRSASLPTTSGSAVDVTNISSMYNTIHVMFRGVGLVSGANYLVQIGDSGGIETTGYASSSAGETSTSGFIVQSQGINRLAYGVLTIRKANAAGTEWVSSHSISDDDTGTWRGFAGGGTKTLSAALDRVRLTTTAGNFDAGSIVVVLEI
jgi:hypothetical protein